MFDRLLVVSDRLGKVNPTKDHQTAPLERKLDMAGGKNRFAMFYDFLFPQYFRGRGVSFLILFIRLFFGALFFLNGLDKMMDFEQLSSTFPSVLGLGSYMSLMLAIFCEFAGSMFLMVGLMTRIVLIPMIFAMAVAFFDVNDGMMPEGELPLIYMLVFFALFLIGPGRYSVDCLIDKQVRKKRA